jgi:hypothetical protein
MNNFVQVHMACGCKTGRASDNSVIGYGYDKRDFPGYYQLSSSVRDTMLVEFAEPMGKEE